MKLGKETETIEYKKSTGELKEGIISAVAMLNKHNRGELYFGVRNDGLAIGQDVSEKTLRNISQAISNHIEPQVFPNIKEVTLDDKTCVHIVFDGEDIPYFAYGRAYLRVADEDRVMSPKELESYILKKNAGTQKWDSEPSDKTYQDVNEKLLREYLDRATTAGRVEFAFTDKADVLNKLSLTCGDKITNVANVMFCDNVGLEIQMAIFATNERITFNDIKRESGTVSSLVDIAEKYIKNNIKWRVELDGSIKRKEIPEIPLEAIREALVNSFCHRDYRISQNNEVAIFKNRVEIYNPGTFPEGLTPNDFIEGSERSIKRNPLLSQLLYYSKDIESFGTGLRRITEACKNANVKVDFQMLKTGFVVVFYRSENVVTDKMTDKPSKENDVLHYMETNEFVTNKVVCELLNISDVTAKRLLKSMVEKGLLKAEGERKQRIYKI